jgi:hypothetical protein
MNGPDWSAKLWWAVPAAAVLVLLGLVLLFGQTAEPAGQGTSYDASKKGFRASYLLLEGLGYPVARSRRPAGRPAGEAARWVLFPAAARDQAAPLDAWVRDGGIVVLADASPEFARSLGMSLKVEKLETDPGAEPAAGAGVARLAGGPTRVEWPGQSGRVWARAGGQPFVTVYPRGAGAVWLVNRPEFLTNRLLAQSDNAVLLCRLAGAVLAGRPGPLGFDEVVHGLRDRPGLVELLLRPPTLWVTAQGLLLVGLLLWHYVPRFGGLRPPDPPTRRSKEEFLDALAALLERKGDCADAWRTARDALRHEVERDLGLPAGTRTDQLVQEAARRRPGRTDKLRRLLTAAGPPAGKAALVKALNELEGARDDFFHGRRLR